MASGLIVSLINRINGTKKYQCPKERRKGVKQQKVPVSKRTKERGETAKSKERRIMITAECRTHDNTVCVRVNTVTVPLQVKRSKLVELYG